MVLVDDRGSANHFSPVQLVTPGYYEGGRQRIRELPPGTEVRIDSVYWVNNYDNAVVEAVGRTLTEPSYIFEYYLGGYPGKLQDVPWDEPQLRPGRTIEWGGKVLEK
jgi:hypothetical protein